MSRRFILGGGFALVIAGVIASPSTNASCIPTKGLDLTSPTILEELPTAQRACDGVGLRFGDDCIGNRDIDC